MKKGVLILLPQKQHPATIAIPTDWINVLLFIFNLPVTFVRYCLPRCAFYLIDISPSITQEIP
jgi:hypothetical protein